MFGFEEIISHTRRKYSVSCSSDRGSLYVIKSEDFIKNVYLNPFCSYTLKGRLDSMVSDIEVLHQQVLANNKQVSIQHGQYLMQAHRPSRMRSKPK